MVNFITASEAAALIQDDDFLASTPMGLGGLPEEILAGIEKRFLQQGHPQNLTFAHACGIGNGTEGRGADYLAHEGLTKRIISGHIGASPRMGKYVAEEKLEAYLFPQGVITQIWRATAGKKPGVITKVGLGTYVDPQFEGAKVNNRTTEELIKRIQLEGEDYLHYPTLPVNVAIIRGTTADEKGNLTNEGEVGSFELLALATAAKNNGGIVIAQVQKHAEAGSLDPKRVQVPGNLIDYVVVTENPNFHYQTMGTSYNPALSGEMRVPLGAIPRLPLNPRKIIARRAAMELKPKSIVNLGIGIPEGVSSVAAEEGVVDDITLTLELGVFGGIPAGGPDFGAAYNPGAVVQHDAMFDFYDGGGLDTAFLGAAQFDKYGNVNVSKFGPRVVGPGGFINISQTSKKVVFCGTFTAGGKAEIGNQNITITDQGKAKKFVRNVEQITFSGQFASDNSLPVLFVTERAVFDIENGQLRLIEIAPGLNLQMDILDWMEFTPVIAEDLKEMSREIFQEEWGYLEKAMYDYSQADVIV
ncbi:acyl CoA:acetate/3-ketoacid CoA transferase [Alkalicoccus saliphilus]|uniref:Acyl CoA:acetate/3-ketoacid CoA transferase n=1 Tax=Alkalicoccus saliphilus TaxID=200989 RepID=A0A2T4U3N0_9BACI|nr:malonate decarboxylase subunit alpha [Alkalicoccus saliphilus]PTL37996.1 acyl CoA:acetate/3-ketoacid CoA transferase [Alkalicoccus saliphilus]